MITKYRRIVRMSGKDDAEYSLSGDASWAWATTYYFSYSKLPKNIMFSKSGSNNMSCCFDGK